ncbi:MAG: hypothetical protein ACRDVM_07460, partial [Acidimicrobiia bacterium]
MELPVGLFPKGLAGDEKRLWVLAVSQPVTWGGPPPSQATVLSVDPDSDAILTQTALSRAPSLLVANASDVWVAHYESGAVTRLDAETGEVVAEIPLELPFDVGSGPDRRLFLPNDLDVGLGSVWVLSARGALAQIDPSTNTVARVVELTPKGPTEVAIGTDAVWVAEDVHGLTRVDPDAHQVSTIPLEVLDHAAQRVAVFDGDVYVAGDRLGRNPDGSFRMEAGGYTPGDEVGISRVDAETETVVGATTVDRFVAMLGWVQGFFGALDTTWTFTHLGPFPQLTASASHTNFDARGFFAQAGRELWMVDHRAGRLHRVVETGPALGVSPIEVTDHMERRPISEEAALSDDWIPLYRGPLGNRWPAVVAWTGEEIVIFGGEPVAGGRPLAGGAAFKPATARWRTMSD